MRALLAGVLLAVAACGEAPTSASAGGPSYDGAYIIGSGNRSDTTGTTTNTAANSGESTAGGAYVIGSGN